MALKDWDRGWLIFCWFIGAVLWVGGLFLWSTEVPEWIRKGGQYALLGLVGMFGLLVFLVIGVPIALLILTLAWHRHQKTPNHQFNKR